MNDSCDPPRHLLAIDTSSSRGSLALLDGGAVVAEETFETDRTHHAALFPPLRRLLDAVGRGGVDAVLAGTGPGSYTAVRIGIAAAHGVALARGWPQAGWPSFTALLDVPCYHVTGDARRGDCFLATVEDGMLGEAPQVFPAVEWADRLEALRHRVCSTDADPPPGVERVFPSAARLAAAWVRAGAPLAIHPVEPVYLRAPFITTPKPPPLDVVCALIRHEDGRLLAARRPEGKALAGKWEFPGGKVEAGEDPAAALRREIAEELGTSIVTGRRLRPVVHDYGDFRIRLTAYRATLAGSEPSPTEHPELRWVDRNEAGGLDWAAADVALLDRAWE